MSFCALVRMSPTSRSLGYPSESAYRKALSTGSWLTLPRLLTATGKAFLAYLPKEQGQEILEPGWVKYTEHTMVSLLDLYEDLRHTRERGFAISGQEHKDGVSAVATNAHPRREQAPDHGHCYRRAILSASA